MDFTARVRRAGDEAACGALELDIRAARMRVAEGEDAGEELWAFEFGAVPDLRRAPRPEAVAQLARPAGGGWPMRGAPAGADGVAQAGDGGTQEQSLDEHHQDRVRRVPAPGKEQVGQDGDRAFAGQAEVTTDEDDDPLARREATDLPLVGAVPDDAQVAARRIRRGPAARAAARTEGIDRGQAGEVGEILDFGGERAYVDHGIVRRGRWAIVRQDRNARRPRFFVGGES